MATSFDRRRMIFYSLLSGLCPLVPVPLLDDWLRDRVRRRLVREMARHHRVSLEGDGIRWLASGTPWSVAGCARGCLSGALFKALLYLIKKVLRSTFRKLLYFLAIKDASDTFSLSFHRALMVDQALASGHLGRVEDPARVWHAMETVLEETDPRPFEASVRVILRGSRVTLKRGARLLRSAIRRSEDQGRTLDQATLEAEAPLLDELIGELDAEVDAAEGYFEQLLARYRAAWNQLHRAGDAAGSSPDEDRPEG